MGWFDASSQTTSYVVKMICLITAGAFAWNNFATQKPGDFDLVATNSVLHGIMPAKLPFDYIEIGDSEPISLKMEQKVFKWIRCFRWNQFQIA